jgi:hypothetical protein
MQVKGKKETRINMHFHRLAATILATYKDCHTVHRFIGYSRMFFVCLRTCVIFVRLHRPHVKSDALSRSPLMPCHASHLIDFVLIARLAPNPLQSNLFDYSCNL